MAGEFGDRNWNGALFVLREGSRSLFLAGTMLTQEVSYSAASINYVSE